MKITPGTPFGHYQIRSQLGAGGMGEVFLAEDTRLERKVALKFLPAAFAQDRTRLKRFTQEARAASALNHPNILTVHEIGQTDDSHFIATEFVEGESLRARMTRDRIELDEVLEISAQIASALSAAHTAGIIHRDIKPENIMLRRDGLVKVLDFGLAKLSEKKEASPDTEAETKMFLQTAPGVVMGTPSYMSPEQARGKDVDARTDVWSLGVVLYEMLAGQVPFVEETTSDVIAAILRNEPAPLGADMPPELNRIVRKALQKKADERYQTVKDLLLDLKNLKRELEFAEERDRSHIPPFTKSANAGVTHSSEQLTAIQPAISTQNSLPHQPSSVEHFAGAIKKRKFVWLGALAALAVALAVTGYVRFFATRTEAFNSIAVLPFVNESGNSDVEYLSDGMTESLINSLSQLPNLAVKARSSVFRYKGRDATPQTIAAELSVQAILNGRVVQRGGDLTLYLSLVDAQSGNQLWGEQYNRKLTDLVSLQSEIARDVSEKLRLRLTSTQQQRLTKRGTENGEAYQLYLKGRYYWYKFPAKEFEKSRDYYQQAIDADPNYALAYAGLSEYYGFGAANGFLPPTNENWSKSETAANKALTLDDTLPDAYNALAGVKQFNGERAGAERELKRAIELNPNYAEGRAHYAMYLIMDVGRPEEAPAQIKKALELEPLSVAYNRNLAVIFYWTRQYDRAVEQCQKTLELDPNDAFTHELLGYAYEQKGMQKEAIAEWSRALTLTGDNEAATMLERTFAASGFTAAVRALWQKKLERFNEKTSHGEYVPAMNYALAYTRLADKEQAFAWLAKAEQERNGLIYAVKLDPIYDSLRSDSRFQDLLRRVGLPS